MEQLGKMVDRYLTERVYKLSEYYIVVDPNGEPTTAELYKLPYPYAIDNRTDAILLVNKDGKEPEVVCPQHIQPVRRIADVTEWVLIKDCGCHKRFYVKDSDLRSVEKLHKILTAVGILVGTTQLKLMVPFMNSSTKQWEEHHV